MELQISMTPAGFPALRYGLEWLDDENDPIAGAVSFVQEEDLADTNRVVLFGTGLGYRLLRLREIGCDPIVFEPNLETLAVCHEVMPDALAGIEIFTEYSPFLQFLMHNYKADDSTKLLTSNSYRRAYPTEYDCVVRILSDAQGFCRIRENSLEERTKFMIESALTNLGRFVECRPALEMDRPLAGCPVFIVSAGPSLDRNGHLLQKAREHGVVFAVNTSGPCVKMHGAEVDVLVSIEAMDASSQMRDINPDILALDLTANPNSFGIGCPMTVAFMQAHPAFNALSQQLGIKSLAYGASVATAAFSLALKWGAESIVMVGQDCAFTDGHTYAMGTGREDGRAYAEGEFLRLEYGLDDLFVENGLKPPPKYQPRVEVPAWGGGTVNTAYDLNMFRRWFESAAYVFRDQARYINATEGGAHVDGFEEIALADVLSELPLRNDRLKEEYARVEPLPDELVSGVREHTYESAGALRRACEKCLRAKKPHIRHKLQEEVRALAKQAHVVETHAAGKLSILRKDKDLGQNPRFKRTFEIIRDSAARVQELVS